MFTPRFCIMVVVALFLQTNGYAQSGGIASLRGTHSLDAISKPPELYKMQNDRSPIPRNYVQQPPIIPHSIKGYKINLRSNKCLTCHNWKVYRESGATKVSITHFTDRNGNELANVAPRRYFCNQCHVSQNDVKPLIENTFSPVRALQDRHAR